MKKKYKGEEYFVPYKKHAPYFTKERTDDTGQTYQILSVTQALSKQGSAESLINWAVRETIKLIDWDKRTVGDYTEIRDWYANIGTTAHRHMEILLEGGTPQLDKEGYDPMLVQAAQNSIKAFERWLTRHKVKKLFTEKVLVSDEHELGGTADLIAEVDGVIEVIDFKTGSEFGKHSLQVAAYAYLARENGIDVEQCRIVFGHRDTGKLKEVIVYNDELENLWKRVRAAKFSYTYL